MSLTSDTEHPQLDVPFRVTLSIGVRENVNALPNVYLPSFFGPEELGDERSFVHTPQGTLYRETLTLEAHARGPLRISAGKMDAIDARDGKPKRFISNDLTLEVQGGPLADTWGPVRAFFALLLYALVPLAALAALVIVVFRRRPTVEAAITDPEPQQDPNAVEKDGVNRSIERLRALRNRNAVLEVRAALWATAGASAGETLEDVLQRLRTAPETQRRAAIAIERAAFIDEERFPAAIDDFLTLVAREAVA